MRVAREREQAVETAGRLCLCQTRNAMVRVAERFLPVLRRKEEQRRVYIGVDRDVERAV